MAACSHICFASCCWWPWLAGFSLVAPVDGRLSHHPRPQPALVLGMFQVDLCVCKCVWLCTELWEPRCRFFHVCEIRLVYRSLQPPCAEMNLPHLMDALTLMQVLRPLCSALCAVAAFIAGGNSCHFYPADPHAAMQPVSAAARI